MGKWIKLLISIAISEKQDPGCRSHEEKMLFICFSSYETQYSPSEVHILCAAFPFKTRLLWISILSSFTVSNLALDPGMTSEPFSEPWSVMYSILYCGPLLSISQLCKAFTTKAWELGTGGTHGCVRLGIAECSYPGSCLCLLCHSLPNTPNSIILSNLKSFILCFFNLFPTGNLYLRLCS